MPYPTDLAKNLLLESLTESFIGIRLVFRSKRLTTKPSIFQRLKKQEGQMKITPSIVLGVGLLLIQVNIQAQKVTAHGFGPLPSSQPDQPWSGGGFALKDSALLDIRQDVEIEQVSSVSIAPPPKSPKISPSLADIYADLAFKDPEEKVHLHLDRDRYFAGDTLWFKSYLFCGGVWGSVSKDLHVELYKDSTRVESKFYPIGTGVAMGELELPDSLPEGMYTIIAYTPWMAHFDRSYFYHFDFPVYHTHTVSKGIQTSFEEGGSMPTTFTTARLPKSESQFDIQFLPEGGNSVMDVRSRVAFIAIDNAGQAVDVEGWIGDESRDTIATFQSAHEGMGIFSYTPRLGKRYYAHVYTPLGQKDILLKTAQSDNVVLAATVVPEGVKVVLKTNNNSRFFNHTLQLVGTMYRNLVYDAKAKLTEDVHVFSGVIPIDSLSNGIMRITLKDDNNNAIAERVVFIEPKRLNIPMVLSQDTISLKPKGYNSCTLHFEDSVSGSFSVAVVDADAIHQSSTDEQGNIFSNLLLTEDVAPDSTKELRGKIHNPDWYFKDDSARTKEALDLVMLTHGWRTFDSRPPTPESESTLTFTGRAYYKNGKKLLRNKELSVLIQSPEIGTRMLVVPVDSAGRFVIQGLTFKDTASAFFQLNEPGEESKDVQLQLDAPQLVAYNVTGQSWERSKKDPTFVDWASKKADADVQYRRFLHAKELQQIFIKGKSRERAQLQILDDRYTFGMFSNTDGFAFDMMHHPEYTLHTDVFEFLGQSVPSLHVVGAPHHYQISYRAGGQPALYLNEMPATVEQLNDIPLDAIAYVKFIYPPFMGAFLGGADGAIAVYLRQGDDIFTESNGLNHVALKGYSNSRQFYTPLYSGESSAFMPSAPDYRLTLSWQPAVAVNGTDVKVPIRFYNNDHSQHVRIVVEGVDKSGRLLHLETNLHESKEYSDLMAVTH